jgi:hypothetical protein
MMNLGRLSPSGVQPSCSRRGHWSSGHPDRGPAGISGATSVAPEPAASKPDDPEGVGSRVTGAKRGIEPAPIEPAEKRKKAEPAAKSLLPPRMKKVIKRRATVVAG